MAAIASTQAGDWDLTSTWVGGVKPVAGDTVTIDHAVTVDTTEVCGTSPSDTTVVLQLNADLTIADGGSLEVRGNLSQSSGDMIVSAGGILEFNATNATPSSTTYKWQIGTAGSQGNKLICNGSSGNRAIVRSNSGGGNAFVEAGVFTRSGWIEASFTDFTRMGDGTNDFIQPMLTGGGDQSWLLNCRLDACGRIKMNTAPNADSTFRFEDNNSLNSVGAGGQLISVYAFNGHTGGTKSFLRNYCDIEAHLNHPNGYDIQDNVFNDELTWNESSGAIGSFERNLIRRTLATVISNYADVALDSYLLLDHTSANPQGLTHASPNSGKVYTHDGTIFEYAGTSTEGEMIVVPTASAAWTLKVLRCITIPNSDGSQIGKLVSALGDVNVTIEFENNTYKVTSASSGDSGLVLGVTYAGQADMVSKFRSNLAWDDAAGGGFKVTDASATVGMITEALCDFNAGYNVSAGIEGNGYDTDLVGTEGTDFGANDVNDIAPNFVDDTRDMAAWDSSLGGAGTRANAMVELAKLNLASHDAAYTPAALHAYVKAGFAPQASEYDGAAHDSGTIGAVAFVGGAPIIKVLSEIVRF